VANDGNYPLRCLKNLPANLTRTPSNPLRRIAASAGEKIGLTMVYSDIIVLALNKAIIDIGAKYG